MAGNTLGSSFNIESVSDMSKVGNRPADMSNGRYWLLIAQACLNILGYVLIGLVVGVNLQFAYRLGPNLSTVNLHIVLCVLGYQLLMGVGILALTSESGFALNISLKHRRWLHTFLQIAGSALALAGCFIMSLSKNINFNTLHGKFALVAMVFTVACFFNGLTSLYAYEWRKFLPANLSKLTHILFGVVAFSMATVSLCYGFEKSSFTNWSTPGFTTALYVFTGLFTAICILNPGITFYSKMNNVIRN